MFPTPLFRFYILVRTQDEICSLKFLSIADYRCYIVQHRSILSTSILPSQSYTIKYSFIKRNSHFLDIKCSSVQSLSHVQLFVTPWTVGHQTLLSMGFFRQEYWSGLPFPSPGDLPDPGIEPGSPTLQADSLPSEPSGKRIMKKIRQQIAK